MTFTYQQVLAGNFHQLHPQIQPRDDNGCISSHHAGRSPGQLDSHGGWALPDWTGSGYMLTASYPFANGWIARGK